MPAMQMMHEVDPKQVIFDQIGSLEDKIVPYANILVGIYERPKLTKSGILLADQTTEEDKYQGKVGLVLKMGPLAFQDDDQRSFGGFKVQIGDWVVFRASDGWALSVNKTDCRMLSDASIKMVIENPDDVW